MPFCKKQFWVICLFYGGLFITGCSSSPKNKIMETQFIAAKPPPDTASVNFHVYTGSDGHIQYGSMLEIKPTTRWLNAVIILNGNNSQTALSKFSGPYLLPPLPSEKKSWSGYMWRELGIDEHDGSSFPDSLFVSETGQHYNALSEKPTRIEVYYKDLKNHSVYWSSSLTGYGPYPIRR